MRGSKHQKQCCLFGGSKVRFPKSAKKPSRDDTLEFPSGDARRGPVLRRPWQQTGAPGLNHFRDCKTAPIRKPILQLRSRFTYT